MSRGDVKPCKHCEKVRYIMYRKLCAKCYDDVSIRILHPTAWRKVEYGPQCRHCGVKRANRPLGLCWSCYYQPIVKSQYNSDSIYAFRGIPDHDRQLPLPVPTLALPGTQEKIAALIERAASGFQLHHPADAVWDEVRILNFENPEVVLATNQDEE